MKRRSWVVLGLIVAACFTLVHYGAQAQQSGSIRLEGGVLQIESPANTFALLVHPLGLVDEPGELVAELEIRVSGAPGASWGPGIYLYWNADEWIAIRHSAGVFRLEGQIRGAQRRIQDFTVTPRTGEWNGLRLVWRRGVVDVFASNDLASWHLLTTVNRPGDGLPWLMVGKGYAARSLPQPFLANVYSEPGSWGTTQIRNLRVTVDGKEYFADDFAGEVLDESVWTPLVDGDPSLSERLAYLESVFQEEFRRRQLEEARSWVSSKVRTNLLTPEQIAQARQTRKWPETGADGSAIIAQAERWMKYSPSQLRDMVPPPEVPRAFDVHFKQSPTHPEEIKAFGSYPWIVDPDLPYKVISPVDGSVFPTNDFDPKNPGRPEDVSEEPYVDNGWGWKDPNDPQKYWFVAYWTHWFWLNHLVPAAERLAQAYILTGEQRYARQAAALLDQIAEYYPRMDYVKQSRYGTEIQPGTYHGRIVNAIWETGVVRTLARAYDFAFEGMEGDTELEAVTGKSIAEIRANIERNLLEEAARSIYTMDGRIRGNFGMHHSALATIAIVLDNENTEKYLDFVLHATGMGPSSFEGIVPGLTNFIYRDGAPNESSPGYNSLWIGHFQMVAELLLRRGIDLYAQYPRLKRLFDMPLRLVMPGNFTPNIGDTGSVKSSGIVGWNAQLSTTAYQRYQDGSYLTGKSPYAAKSDNMSSYGLGMLRRGSGQNAMGISMYYGQSGGHGHFDRLNIELFALGYRLMPDLGYPEYMTAYHKKLYGWTGHTISHNTVMVNQERQHTKDGGRIEAFASSPTVQYMEARAEEAYPGVVDRYQRAVALIDVSPQNAYAVDIFRVRGGTHHDYSIHGPDGDLTFHNLELSEVQERGTLAGEDVPFGYLYDAPQFEVPGYSGSYSGYRGSGYSYLRHVQRGTPEGVWSSDWTVREDRSAHLRATFIPEPGAQVVVADGEPPQNQQGNPKNLKYILVQRRAAGEEPLESTFVTILEPYRGEPFIVNVSRRDSGESGADGLVALAIERTDGSDYLFHSAHTRAAERVGDDYFEGRFGVVSRDRDGAVRFGYLLSGRVLRQGDLEIETPGSYEGEIVAIDFAARQVTVRFDAGPRQVPVQALAGQRLVISNDLHATEYIVEDVAPAEGGLYRLTLGETDFLTGMGELSSAVVDPATSGSVLGSRTPLVLGTHYRGQWLVDAATGAGGRIVDIAGAGSRIVLDREVADLAAGDRFEIYDFGIGDRFVIASFVHVEARAADEYLVQSNVPARVRLSDGRWHELEPGEHVVHVAAPKVVWTAPGGAGQQPARGALPLVFAVEVPEGLDVTEVALYVGDELLYAGQRAPEPGQIRLDTERYPDGDHTLSVVVVDSLGRRFRESITVQVDNWWEEVDDLRPPIAAGWFTADFTKTSARSAGWEYRTDQRDAFYNDANRLAPVTPGLEYLVWDAPALREFAVTLYARRSDPAVRVEVSPDGAAWQAVDVPAEVEGPNAAGWYAVRLAGVLDEGVPAANHFRLLLLESDGVPQLQVGQVVLRGRNLPAGE